MKKLLFLLLLIPSLAWGQVSTSGVSLSGCSTGGGAVGSYTEMYAYDTNDTAFSGGYDTTADRYCLSGDFVVGGTGFTVRKADIYLKQVGTSTQTITVFVCDSGSTANCVQADQTISVADIDTSGEWMTVTWATGKALSASTEYTIVLSSNTIGTDNRWAWYVNSAQANGNIDLWSNPTSACAGSWAELDTGASVNIKLYKYE